MDRGITQMNLMVIIDKKKSDFVLLLVNAEHASKCFPHNRLLSRKNDELFKAE